MKTANQTTRRGFIFRRLKPITRAIASHRGQLAWIKSRLTRAASQRQFPTRARSAQVLLCGLWLIAALGVTLPVKAQPASVGQANRTNPAPATPRGQTREITWQNRRTLLQEGRRLTSAQVEAIETDLKSNPSDEAQWARLLGYYAGQATETNALPLARIEARIIEARPLSPLVDPASKSLFSPLWIDPKCFEVVANKWITVARQNGSNAAILACAGRFLMREPSAGNYARQGEEFLQRARALEPRNTRRSLELAEQYLNEAHPCFDNPNGNAAAARKALACFQTAWRDLAEGGRDTNNLKVRQSMTRAAFWAGEYDQAKKYAQDWLKASAKMEQMPAAATHNERITRQWDRGEAIHDANMILGEIALSEGKTKEAGQFLIEAGKVTGGLTLSSYGPDLALAKDLLDLGENQAVLTFFEECNVFWTTGRDSLVQWKKTILAGQKPDFGPGFHFGFKRLQP